MARNKETVAEKRNYLVLNVAQAKSIVRDWLLEIDLSKTVKLGLPEVDDRYHCWRVPLRALNGKK